MNSEGSIYFEVNKEDFDLKHIFECGQCFRWDANEDGSYTGTAGGRVADMYHDEGKLRIRQTSPAVPEDEKFWRRYLDLDNDYGRIKDQLSKDPVLKKAIPYGYGIRILQQDPWETTVSFIISQNNNIPRIKKNIRDLAQLAGKKISACSDSEKKTGRESVGGSVEREWHDVPGPEKLAEMTEEDLAPVRLGYRARYLIETAKCVCQRGEEVLYEDLDSLCGVGPKVASCIRLFGLQQMASFPVDVWVKRVMKDLYGLEKPEEIKNFAAERFGEYGGYAQQYLFYYVRERDLGNLDL